MNHNNLSDLLNRDVDISVAALDIRKCLDEPKIIEDVKNKVVTKLATTDELTGFYVREVFNVMLTREIERAK